MEETRLKYAAYLKYQDKMLERTHNTPSSAPVARQRPFYLVFFDLSNTTRTCAHRYARLMNAEQQSTEPQNRTQQVKSGPERYPGRHDKRGEATQRTVCFPNTKTETHYGEEENCPDHLTHPTVYDSLVL